jgi:MYXO-CTERM domain-containing protein
VHHCANGIIITSEQTGNVDGVKVHDNLVHDIGFNGVSVSHYEVAPNVIDNVHVFNNTVARIGYPENKPYFLPPEQKNATWGDGIAVGKPDVKSVVIRDNLLWDIGGGEPLAIAAGLVGHTVEGNVTTDPLFVDYASRDLRVGTGSPAIDQGTGTRIPTDLDYYGNLRVAGSKVDVGAFEYGSVPAAGGAAGAAGSSGAGGATGQGGAAGSSPGGSAGAPGAGGEAGSAPGGAAGSAAPAATGGDDGGCGCAAPGSGAGSGYWLLGLAGCALAARSRRRASRRNR